MCHPDRVRANYTTVPTTEPIVATSVIDTHVIQSVERDVRAVLDFMDMQYTDDELRQAMKRLRKWVGYQA